RAFYLVLNYLFLIAGAPPKAFTLGRGLIASIPPHENLRRWPRLRGASVVSAVRSLRRKRIGTRYRRSESRVAEPWTQLHQTRLPRVDWDRGEIRGFLGIF